MSEQDPTKETPPAKTEPSFLTRAEVEAMMSAQTAQITQLLTRTVEMFKPADPPARGTGGDRKSPTFYDQPDEAAAALFDAKMKPLQDAYVKGESSRQLEEVAKLPYASDYIKEINDIVERAPEHLKIQPGYAKGVYHLIMGVHKDEVFAKMKEAEARKPEFTETTSHAAPPAAKSDNLTAEEKAIADRTGVPHDEYKKWRDNPDAMRAAAMAGPKRS